MLDALYTAIAWVLKTWHSVFATFLDPAGGWAWTLSIVFLVITVRAALTPLVVRQIRSQRAMQDLRPELAELRTRYGADRAALGQAVTALQRERGVHPLAGCLPVLLQAPVFIALLHVLRRLAPGRPGLYGWSPDLTQQAAVAKLLGAPISSSLTMQEPKRALVLQLTDGSSTGIRVVALLLIVLMCATTFATQKLLQRRSGPVEGQAATVQKLLLYGMPVGLAVSGALFPIGVLLYWTTNNLWTLGQQAVSLRRLPPPGSRA
jgi:YidC/Oxa1 family membrane protein insertase